MQYKIFPPLYELVEEAKKLLKRLQMLFHTQKNATALTFVIQLFQW